MEAAFASWESFYVIIGSSSAALIGLQFVVISLGSESYRLGSEREVEAFATPTIVHFSTVLILSAILSAPWQSLWAPATCLALSGLAGLIYCLIVLRRAKRQTGYKPVLEDWLFHTIFPFFSYTILLIAGLLLPHHPTTSLFIIAATALALLFIAIHNAWDAVIFLALARRRKLDPTDSSSPAKNS